MLVARFFTLMAAVLTLTGIGRQSSPSFETMSPSREVPSWLEGSGSDEKVADGGRPSTLEAFPGLVCEPAPAFAEPNCHTLADFKLEPIGRKYGHSSRFSGLSPPSVPS